MFEGRGYSSKGIFRPEMEYRMKSNGSQRILYFYRNAIKRDDGILYKIGILKNYSCGTKLSATTIMVYENLFVFPVDH